MYLLREICKFTLIWVGVIILLLLLLLFPRNETYLEKVDGTLEPTFIFNWKEYQDNIKSFIADAWSSKSLGQTRLRMSVEEEVKRHVSRSIPLIITAFIISISMGVWKGIFDFRSSYGKFKNIIGKGTTWLFQSVPDYFIITSISWIALLLIKHGFTTLPLYNHVHWYSFIIPSLVLSIYPTMYVASITSNALHSQESLLYLRTAKAKGLSDTVTIYKHALANCLHTIFNHFSSVMLYILSSLIIVEYLLFYRGAAYRLYEALGFRAAGLSAELPSEEIEIGLIFGFFIFFSITLLIAQIIGGIGKYVTNPKIN